MIVRSAVLVGALLGTACGGAVDEQGADPTKDGAVGDVAPLDDATPDVSDADAIEADAVKPVPRPPSCVAGGPGADFSCSATHADDCCASDVVPGGKFYRFFNGVDETSKEYPATVSAFTLDRYEITVGRFRAFVNAYAPPASGSGAHPIVAASGWKDSWPIAPNADALRASLSSTLECDVGDARLKSTWTNDAGPNEHLPITCITWYEMFAFCAWDRGRLPTQAEWVFASSGGDEQRVFPWSVPAKSTAIDRSRAIYNDLSGVELLLPAEVGSLLTGAGRWKTADLGGNVAEWLLDRYMDVPPKVCVDCAAVPAADEPRALHGGSFNSQADTLRSAWRDPKATKRTPWVSGRCAR